MRPSVRLVLPALVALQPQALPAQDPPPSPARRGTLPVETYLGPSLRAAIGALLARPTLEVPDGGPMARRPSLARSVGFKAGKGRILPEALAASLRGLDGKGRKAAAATFQAMLEAYEQEAPRHDVAHALAYCVGVSRQTARGSDLSSGEVQELSRRTLAILLQVPEFQALSDRDRQAMYESLVLTGGMVGGLAREAQDSDRPEARRRARALAQQVLDCFPGEPGPGGPSGGDRP
ncbi:MAG: DUF6683 family protein [Holophagaceae bacterium]